MLAATHITNRLPSEVLKGLSPYEMLYKKKPNYRHLKCFGCLAFGYNPRREKDKSKLKEYPASSLDIQASRRGIDFTIF